MKQDLETLRQQIDKVDQRLIKDLQERFDLLLKVSSLKKQYQIPSHDPQREAFLIEIFSSAAESELEKTYLKEIAKCLHDKSLVIVSKSN